MEMQRIREEAKRVEDSAKRSIAELGDRAETLVRYHPWKMMAVVASAGVLVGALLSRLSFKA